MFRSLVTLVALALASGIEVQKKPIYKYRYETEDVMKTAASTIPIHGYHVVEGGYYPIAAGLGGGIGGGQFIGGPAKLGAIGGGGFGAGGAGLGGGFYPGIGIGGAGLGYGGAGIGLGAGGVGGGLGYGGGIGGGYVPIAPIAPIHHGAIGGEYIDKNVYSGGKKNANDEHYEKINGKKGEEINHGQSGFKKGEAAIKNAKGDSAYYSGEEADKKAAEDEKVYHGGHHYNQEAKNSGEKKEKKGHKKGHVIKGFKTSHHKDETGKTEEYYDEENDEGSHYNFNGEAGQFGKKDEAAYKGGHENEQFHANKGKKEGHYDSHQLVDNANADHGEYGSKKYAGSGSAYGVNNGIDQQSLLGHQESSRFFKHHPHVPIY